MIALKGKRLFWSAIFVCISLPVSPVLNLFVFPIISDFYQAEDLMRVYVHCRDVATILNILVFASCAWNMRESKRLCLSLCLYIITQVIIVVISIIVPTVTFSVSARDLNINTAGPQLFASYTTISTSALIEPFASGCLLYFYTAFCRHPESSLRISAVLAAFGYAIKIITDIAFLLFALLFRNEHYNTAMSVISVCNLFSVLFSAIFWIVFAMVMRKVSRTA